MGRRLKNPEKELTIQVLTNLSCNLNCDYCYEHNKNGRVNDADSIKQFIKAMVDSNPGKDVYIVDVIGGEPFLVVDLLTDISEFAVQYVKAKGKKLVINVTTNGTLLGQQKVADYICRFRDYLSLGLSIDGREDVHDTHRKYVNGRGSYTDIVRNLNWLFNVIPKCRIGVKATFTVTTFNKFAESIIHLIDLGFMTVSGNVNYEDTVDLKDGLVIAREFIKVADYLIENNLEDKVTVYQLTEDVDFIRQFNRMLYDRITHGIAKLDRNYCGSCVHMKCIGFDDVVYGCARFCTMQKPNMHIGVLRDGKIDFNNESFFKSVAGQYQRWPKECQECVLNMYCPSCLAMPYEVEGFKPNGMCGWTYGVALARFYMCTKLFQKEAVCQPQLLQKQ